MNSLKFHWILGPLFASLCMVQTLNAARREGRIILPSARVAVDADALARKLQRSASDRNSLTPSEARVCRLMAQLLAGHLGTNSQEDLGVQVDRGGRYLEATNRAGLEGHGFSIAVSDSQKSTGANLGSPPPDMAAMLRFAIQIDSLVTAPWNASANSYTGPVIHTGMPVSQLSVLGPKRYFLAFPNSVRVLNFDSTFLLSPSLIPLNGKVFDMVLSADKSLYAVASSDGRVSVRRALDHSLVKTWIPRFNQRPVKLAFSPDGKMLAVAYLLDGVYPASAVPFEIFETSKFESIHAQDSVGVFFDRHTFWGHVRGQISSLRFSPDGKSIAIGSDNKLVQIFRIGNWSGRGDVAFATSGVTAHDFMFDSSASLFGSAEGEIFLVPYDRDYFYPIHDSHEVKRFGIHIESGVTVISTNPVHVDQAAIGFADGSVILIKYAKDTTLARGARPHYYEVQILAHYSPPKYFNFTPKSMAITAIQWLPDGNAFVTSSLSGDVIVQARFPRSMSEIEAFNRAFGSTAAEKYFEVDPATGALTRPGLMHKN